MNFASFEHKEYYYARAHRLKAQGAVAELEKKLQASPWLVRTKFRFRFEAAQIFAASMAQKETYWKNRLLALQSKYSPDQPRVPAGNSDGGQWTDGGGISSFGRVSGTRDVFRRKPEAEIVNAQFTPRGPRSGRGANFQEPTFGQQARLAAAEANARDAIRRVQEVDPNYRPSASWTATGNTEGDITKAEALTREAQERYGDVVGRMPLEDILMPGGKPVGTRVGRAGNEVRTISPNEFETLVNPVKRNGEPVTTPNSYNGQWYRRPDGSVVGIRKDRTGNETMDVIISTHPSIKPNFKVHQK